MPMKIEFIIRMKSKMKDGLILFLLGLTSIISKAEVACDPYYFVEDNITYCGLSAEITLRIINNTQGLPEAGSTIKWQEDGVRIPLVGSPLNITRTVSSNHTYSAIITSSCQTETLYAYVTKVTNNTPSISDVNICENDIATFTVAPVQSGVTYEWQYYNASQWTNIAYSGSLPPAGQLGFTINGTGYSNLNIYNATSSLEVRVRATRPNCAASLYDNANLVVSPYTYAGNISSTASRCGSGSVSFQLLGRVGTILNWRSRYKNGSGAWSGWTIFTEIDNVTNTSTSLSEWSGGTRTYEIRAYVKSGVCDELYASKQVIINPTPALPTPNSNNRCDTGTISLSGSPGTHGNTLRWYTVSSGGTHFSQSTTYAPSLSSSKTYYISTYNTTTGCEGSRTPITATINPIPAIPIPTSNARCGTGTVALSATVGTNGNSVRWYAAASGGAHFRESTTYSPNLSSTTTYYISSFNITTLCESSRVPIAATINPLPSLPAASNQIRCGSGNVTLTALSGPNGNTTRWYASSLGGSHLYQGISYTVTVTSSITYYYVSSYNTTTGCESSSRKAVSVTVDAASQGGTVNGGVEAFGVANGTLTLVSNTGTVQNWLKNTNGTGWVNVSNTTTILNYSNIIQTTEYQAEVKSGVCASAWSTIATVTIYNIPVITNLGRDNIALNETTTLSTDGGYFTYQWSRNGINLTGETSSTLTATKPGDYTVWIQASVGGPTHTTQIYTIGSIMDQQTNLNYITSIDYLKEGVNESIDLYDLTRAEYSYSTQYFDGLGRPFQTVSLGSSPLGNDVVLPIEYDNLGRMVKDFLPYTTSSREGIYKADAIIAQYDFYQTAPNIAHDPSPYAQKVFEPSPLNRVLEQGAPGAAWQPNGGATVKFAYEINTLFDGIKIWTINLTTGLPETPGSYPAGELYKNITTDEANHMVEEFTNKLGQTILKRVQVNELATEWADTYYIYDDFGNLRYVFPPEINKSEILQVVPTASNPLAQWDFNEGNGTTLSEISGIYNGAVTGATWSDGKYDKGLSFDGVNDYVNINNSAGGFSFIQNTGVFTISMYIKIKDLNKRSVLLSSASSSVSKGFNLMYETVGGEFGNHQLRFSSTQGVSGQYNLTKGAENTIDDNLWHHVAVVGDGSTIKFYVDGKADGQGQPLQYYSSGNSDFDTFIGGSRSSTGGLSLPFDGSIDELRIYNQALNQSEISSLATSYFPIEILNRWAFQYKYDGRRRMVEKKVPGAEPVYMVYDNRDRLVLTQDGNQRLNNKWLFTKYDALNRPVLTGNYTNIIDTTRAMMQTKVNAEVGTTPLSWYETTMTTTGNVHGYDNASFPIVSNETAYHTVTYYDNYTFRDGLVAFGAAYNYDNTQLGCKTTNANYCYPATEFARVKGQVTGSKVKNLDDNTWLNNVSYYDDRYRVIQTIAQNHKGGIDVSSNLYDFVGKVLETKTTHNDGSSTKNITRTFDYDHAGRLIDTNHELAQKVTDQRALGVEIGEELITKTAVFGTDNGGFSSKEVIPEGENGWIEVEAVETNKGRSFGLTQTDNNYTRGDIDFVINIDVNDIYVIDNGTILNFGAYASGDKFRVARNEGVITYLHNGTVLYTSTVQSTSALMADFSFLHQGATIYKPRISTVGKILLAHNEYNELGELIDKKLHSADGTTYAQSVDYRYNIRGWLTKINESDLTETETDAAVDYFGMNLGYNKQLDLTATAELQFNGNISAVKWSKGIQQNATMGYQYQYDPMNRITNAQSNNTAPNAFNLDAIGYDLNGNIESLSRNDRSGNQMDALGYAYIGNRLMSVKDDALAAFKDGGFKDGHDHVAMSQDDYDYDDNGNMTQDLNKDIKSIEYNHLNLPSKVIKNDDQYIKYIYDATGIKLAQEVYNAIGALQKRTDYIGEFIYQQAERGLPSQLQFIQHEEGRIVNNYLAGINLISNDDASTLEGIVGNQSVTLSNVVIGDETYIKGVSNQSNSTPGIWPIGGAHTVTAGESYTFSLKGYTSTDKVARIYITTNLGAHIWSGATMPQSSGQEAWISETFTIPAGATWVKVGVLWPSANVGSEIYINDVSLIQNDLTTHDYTYQYHLKDHLGNTRVTFTTKPDTFNFTLNYEEDPNNPDDFDSSVPDSLRMFKNVQIASIKDFNRTVGSSGYDKSQVLRSSPNSQVGSVLAIPVGQGDKITAIAYAKYVAAAQDPNVSATTIASALVSAFTGTATSGVESGTGTINNNFGSGSVIGGAGFPLESGTAPKAFLNLMFLPDGDPINLVKDASFAYDQIADGASEALPGNGISDSPFDELKIEGFVAPAQGYVMIYVSNEGSLTDVYFDDIAITVNEHPVIQTDDYYPFGLAFNNGYQRVTAKENRFKYNGFEFQTDLDWGVYDYQARYYDPVIGRFLQVDPAAEMFYSTSPHAYSFNNPINYVDRDGMVPELSGGTDPAKLYGKTIDMSNAPGSKVNAAGHPRNGPWFWKKMLEKHPEMFSDDNVRSIRSGKSPVVDSDWVKHNPTHADYKGGKLVHHHIDQGKTATGIPESAHRKFNKTLHTNRGGRTKGSGLGKTGGALGVAGFALDLVNSFRGEPHSLGMQFTAGFSTNKLYFDNKTEQYFEITNRKDIKGTDGNVIGKESTYDTYSSYTYDKEAGKYVGVNKTGSYTVTKYEGEEAKTMFLHLMKGT
jgi:RHS repeat-associated protein